jgi:dihydrofolate reductase
LSPAVIFSMGVSVDGFVAAPGGLIDWTVPDEELHQFHNDRVRDLGGHLLGRRLYETMLYWETPRPDDGPVERDFAAIWNALPKVVFSNTLSSVSGSNYRLARGGIAEELERLRAEVDGDIEVGGAGLAAECTRLGLIDEYQLFVHPIVLGGGTPYFPPLDHRIELELVETRTFSSRVVYLRYRRV